jgi:putative transcriptional regulator
MKITHHPAAESLMSCSAGSMPEAFAAVMASHMSICSCCQKDLAVMEQVGTILFESLTPSPVTRTAPVIAMRGGEADRVELEPFGTVGDVPASLAPVVGPHLDDIAWKRVSPGVWHYPIELTDEQRGDLRLVKVAAGQCLPEHGHSGSEMTLVLRGSYTDASGRYNVGDVADLSIDTEHRPIADQNEGCICLIATEGRMKFRSVMARVIQPFTSF